MSKIVELFNYMRQCPELADLWSIAATEDVGVRVILPQGASAVANYEEEIDVYGCYHCDIIPYPSVFEDYQVNCFQVYDVNDSSSPGNNINVLNFDAVQAICDWVKEQNDNNNLPNITGEKVVAIECNPSIPQIQGVTPKENTICYFITIRVRYVNKAKRKSIEYELED